MTNFEKWENEILKLAKNKRIFAVDKRDMSVCDCEEISCCECTFQDGSYYCNNERIMWLYEEYQEPKVDWSTVAVDTPILVSNSTEKWHKRYFCKYEDGKVFTWLNGSTSWTADDIPAITTKRYTSWDYAKLAEEDAE